LLFILYMNINIRAAETPDMAGIHALIRELAIYEKAENEMELTLPQLEADHDAKLFHAFIAESKESGELLGMALFYPVYSTWKGLSYYLEDIVVKEKYRCKGIGTKLFDAVAEFAKEKNAGRLKWQVLDWNEPAINFYKKYNAVFDKEWLTCRLTRDQLQNFIEH
jgi:GNAT superfamily N-acetyltransferase